MSLFEVERFIFELKHDEKLQAAMREKHEHLFDAFELSEPERQALATGAIEELYRIGVHPLLIAPYSRYAGISPADYHLRMAALEGSRMFCSTRRYTSPGE